MFRPVIRRRSPGGMRNLPGSLLLFPLIIAVAATIVIVPTPLNAAVVIAPLAGFLLLLYPVLIPFALLATVPVQDAIPIPEEIPLTATRVMTGVAAALIPFILLRRTRPWRWSRFLIALAGLMFAMTLSLVSAESLSASAEELYRWLVAGFTFWLILQFVETRRQVTVALGLVGVLALIQGGIGLSQALTGAGPASFQIGAGFSRAFGTFGMPNSFAAYMETTALPLIPVTVWAAGQCWTRVKQYRLARLKGYLNSQYERHELGASLALLTILGSGTIVGLSAIALSFSRGGWLGSIAALAVMTILLGKRAVFTSTLLAAAISLTLILSAPGAVLSEVQERFEQIIDQVQIGDVSGVPVTDDNFATIERMSHWQTAIAMWDEHPWTGVGAGNFDERFPEFAVHPQFDESQGHAHNYYLHLLAETGLIGLIAYLVFLIATLIIGWRACRSPDSLSQAIGIGAIGLSVALIVHNVFENLHVLNISLQMMLIWALALIATSWRANIDNRTVPDSLLYDSERADEAHRGADMRSPLPEQH